MTDEQRRRIDDHRPAVGLQWDENNPPPRTPIDRPEQWTILLTSGNHGLVGAYGHTFPHAEGDHERINVVDEAVVIKLRDRVRELEAAAQLDIDVHVADGAGQSLHGYGNWHAAFERESLAQAAPVPADNPSTAGVGNGNTIDVKHEFEMWASNRGESAVYIGDGLYQSGFITDQAEAFAAGFELGRAAPASPAQPSAAEAARDAIRLMFVMQDIDGFGGVEWDKHEYAMHFAAHNGHDEPNSEDELTGVRMLIDAAMVAKSTAAQSAGDAGGAA